jgi:ribonucleoside-diphosphate reductase alpha chain
MQVVKRNGNQENFDFSKIEKVIEFACPDSEDSKQFLNELKINLKNNMSTRDIHKAVTQLAVEKIGPHSTRWDAVASKLYLYNLVKEASLNRNYSGFKYGNFYDLLVILTNKGLYHKSILENYSKDEIDEIGSYIKPERDFLFTYVGIKTFAERYIVKGHSKEFLELPQEAYAGISLFLALAEKPEERIIWAKQFYDVLSLHQMTVATPTMSNARKPFNQLSSCFTADTPVMTPNGAIPIAELNVGDTVVTHTGSLRPIIETFCRNYNGVMYDITVKGMPKTITSVTEEHPFLVKLNRDSEPVWKAIKDVPLNSYIAIGSANIIEDKEFLNSNEYFNGETYFTNAESQIVGREYGFHSQGTDRVAVKAINKMLPQINTNKEFFRLLGYYLSEGYVMKSSHSGVNRGLRFTFNAKEESYIKDCASIIRDIFNIEPIIRYNQDNSANIDVHSVIIGNMFASEFNTGFDKKTLPRFVRFATIEKQKQLLIGLIRGDGTTYSHGMKVQLTNPSLVKTLWEIAIRCGLTAYLRQSEKMNLSNKPGAILDLVHTDSEHDFFEAVGKDIHKLTNFVYSPKSYRDNSGQNFFQLKQKTKKNYSGNVYNIEVAEDHSYVVNGLIAHNCFIGTSEDSLESIYNVNELFAQVSKHGGGMGLYIGKIRAANSDIRGFKNTSGGVVPWIRQFNDTAVAVNQLGVRAGSISITLDIWHRDIHDFLQLKTNVGDERKKAHDVFPAISVPDVFMQQLKKSGKFYLFCPHEIKTQMGWNLEDFYGEEFETKYWECVNNPNLPKEEVLSRDLMKEVIKSVTETGGPFFFFRDTVNKSNPNKHAGMVYASNLCTEIIQNMSPNGPVERKTYFDANGNEIIVSERKSGDFVVCNLSSLNLGKVFEEENLAKVVPLSIRMMDNVIDMNYYPIEEARITNKKYRAVGLGTSGYHHMLVQNSILWDSEKHVEFADEIYENINYYSIKASMEIAKEKGAYSEFIGSDWQTGKYFEDRGYNSERWLELKSDVAKYGIRNGYLIAIAPTGSTSLLSGSTASIDPVYDKYWIESKKGSVVPAFATELDKYFWRYLEAHKVSQTYSIKAAGARQKHIDQSQSFNIYITTETTAAEIMKLYFLAWTSGLKTTYYVRSRSVEVEDCISCSS